LRGLCTRRRTWAASATRTRRSRWDMDLIALALIVGLAAVGLAWLTFADRI
jgi:hypothetical protein